MAKAKAWAGVERAVQTPRIKAMGQQLGWERKSELFEFKKVLERASILDDWFLFFISSLEYFIIIF